MSKYKLDSWTRSTSKDVCDWFAAQKPKTELILNYGRDDVDVTASAIDEVRKTWTENMKIIEIERDIKYALRLCGRVSNIEMKTCWNEPTTIEVKVDIARGFNAYDIHSRLSKLPWVYRVVHMDYDSMSRVMEIAIELNENSFNKERTNDMPPKENRSGYFATVKNNIDILNYGLGGSMKIDRVTFNGPATIVFWTDGTKTIVKCMEDEEFDPEKGLAMAICKRLYGGKFHKTFKDAIKNAKW